MENIRGGQFNNPMQWVTGIKVITLCSFKEKMRYRLDFILTIIISFIMGIMLAFGLTTLSVMGPSYLVGSKFYLGYLLWTLYHSTANRIGLILNNMARQGVLERVLTLPLNPLFIVSAYNVAQSVEGLCNFWILMSMGMLFGVKFKFNFVPALVVLLIVLLFFAGLSFVFAGLTLVFKRVIPIMQFVNLLLLGSGVYAVGKLSPVAERIVSIIPYTYAAHLLREIEIDGIGWAEVLPQLPILLLSSLGFLGVGVLVFEYCNKYAREKGIIGHF